MKTKQEVSIDEGITMDSKVKDDNDIIDETTAFAKQQQKFPFDYNEHKWAKQAIRHKSRADQQAEAKTSLNQHLVEEKGVSNQLNLLNSEDMRSDGNILTNKVMKHEERRETNESQTFVGEELSHGKSILCKYRGSFVPAQVSRCRQDGTYDVLFKNGLKQFCVPKSSIQSKEEYAQMKKISGTESTLSHLELLKNKIESSKVKNSANPTSIDPIKKGLGEAINEEVKKTIVEKDHSNTNVDYTQVRRRTGRNDTTQISKNNLGHGLKDSLLKEASLSVGSKVECRYRGKAKFYPAIIKRDHGNGFYDILYEDGDREFRVSKDLVRSRDESLRDMAHKNKEESFSDISSIDQERNKSSGEKKVQIMPSKLSSISRRKSGDKTEITGTNAVQDSLSKALKVSSSFDGEGDSHTSDGKQQQNKCKDEGDLVVGTKVESRYRGKSKYYPATIKRDHGDGSYDILYEDGDREFRVSGDLIRSLDNGIMDCSNRNSLNLNQNRRKLKKAEQIRSTKSSRHQSRNGVAAEKDTSNVAEISYSKIAENLDTVDDNASDEISNIHQQETKCETNRLMEGSKVECTYRGTSKFHQATIKRDHGDGSYDVLYENGESEFRLSKDLIRPLGQSPHSKKGQSSGLLSVNESKAQSKLAKFTTKRETGEEILKKSTTSEKSIKGVCKNEDMIVESIVNADDSGDCRTNGTGRKKENNLSVGDEVDCRYRGKSKYYPATIKLDHGNGTFDVLYEDGDHEFRVSEDFITPRGRATNTNGTSNTLPTFGRRRSEVVAEDEKKGTMKIVPHDNESLVREEKKKPDQASDDTSMGRSTNFNCDSSPQLKQDESKNLTEKKKRGSALVVGSKVQCRYRGKSKFYPATIKCDHGNGSYDILYEDGDREFGVKRDLICPFDLETPLLSTGSASFRENEELDLQRSPILLKDKQKNDNNDDVSRNIAKEFKTIKVGTKVESRYGGKSKFYPATIKRDYGNGTFDLLYDDGDREFRVSKDLIRITQFLKEKDTEFRDAKMSNQSLEGRSEERGKQQYRSSYIKRENKSDDESFEADKGNLYIGCAVECQYKGLSEYYPARIQAAHGDGTFDIAYEDGDQEFRVKKHLIRMTENKSDMFTKNESMGILRNKHDFVSKQSDRYEEDYSLRGARLGSDCYLVGSKVEANFMNQGVYYPGQIISIGVNACNYDIKYDDGDMEQNVPKDNIRLIESERPSHPKMMFPLPVAKQSKIPIGCRVRARFQQGHEFFPGTILSCTGNTYDILYDDGDREFGVREEFITKEDEYLQRQLSNTSCNFSIGQKVQIRQQGRDRWFDGSIEATQHDGCIVIMLRESNKVNF